MESTKIPAKSYLKLILLCMVGAAFYQIPYLRWTFYDAMVELSGLDNTKFGLTMSMYGTISAICYFPGGIIADKVSSKILLPISSIGTGICGIILMLGPGYAVQLAAYAGLALLGTVTFWSALMKATRNLDNGGDGSRMLGLLEGGRGLFQTVFSFIFLAVFGTFANAVGGVKAVLGGYAALNIVLGIASFFLLEDDNIKGAGAQPLKVKDVVEVVKMPIMWLITIIVLASYSFHLASTYMTPYFTNIIGATAVLAGVLSVVRNYIAQMAGGPLGSFLATKTKSSSLSVAIGYCLMTLGIAVILILPSDASSMTVMIIFMVLAALSIYIIRGIYFGIIGECGIPFRLMGTAVGFASVLGFTPDIFMSVWCGSILDKDGGVGGYRTIFTIMLGCAVLGLISSWIVYFMCKKAKAAKAE